MGLMVCIAGVVMLQAARSLFIPQWTLYGSNERSKWDLKRTLRQTLSY